MILKDIFGKMDFIELKNVFVNIVGGVGGDVFKLKVEEVVMK